MKSVLPDFCCIRHYVIVGTKYQIAELSSRQLLEFMGLQTVLRDYRIPNSAFVCHPINQRDCLRFGDWHIKKFGD